MEIPGGGWGSKIKFLKYGLNRNSQRGGGTHQKKNLLWGAWYQLQKGILVEPVTCNTSFLCGASESKVL